MINIGEGLKALDFNCYIALLMSTMFDFDQNFDGNHVHPEDRKIILKVDNFVQSLIFSSL